MDAVISGIVAHSHAVVNQGAANTDEAMSQFFTADAVFTNAMGGQFCGRAAITAAWSKWFSTLKKAEDDAVDRVFDHDNLRAHWDLTGRLTVISEWGGLNHAEFRDTLSAQFVERDGKVLIAELKSKLHHWRTTPVKS